jgi:hypothetical protein
LATDDVFPANPGLYDPQSPEDRCVLFPEYLTCEDKSQALADHVVSWLTDREAHARLRARLDELKQTVGHGGASRRAADYILDALARAQRPLPRPHFLPSAAQRLPRVAAESKAA